MTLSKNNGDLSDRQKKRLLKNKDKKPYFKLFGKSYKKSESAVGLAFIAPATILGIIFVILPMVISLAYAFTDAYMLDLTAAKWNNFGNFKRLFTDTVMWKALGNTAIFVVIAVPVQLIIALGLALILNIKTLRCSTFFRWAFFCPVMLSLAVTSMLWMNLMDYNDGLINTLLEKIGLGRQLFLKSETQALFVIIFVSVWQGAGYQMLIFLSALKNIPPELYEAASMDGASKAKQFWSITLPSIKPTTSYVLVTTLIGAFRLITQPMIMTGGGPLNSTLTMSYYIYIQGVEYWDVGYSSAIALFYTVIMATIALTLRKVTGGDNTGE